MSLDHQFVDAVSRGFGILRCFTAEQPRLTNGAIARMTRLPRSSVSRLTHTLVKLGILDYDTDAGTYRLGLCVLSLLPAALAGAGVVTEIVPHMTELAGRLGVRVLLTAYDNYALTVVQGVCTNAGIGPTRPVGSRYGIPGGSLGRAYMASCAVHERHRILDHLAAGDGAQRVKLGTVVDQAVSSYRTRGYCISLGELRPGSHGISVSLSPRRLGQRLVLSCGGPAQTLTEHVLDRKIAPLLLETAQQIEGTTLPP